ncbi:MAG: endonuclease/exonuclease/phosphatase family protein [Pseudomonadota bacterium]
MHAVRKLLLFSAAAVVPLAFATKWHAAARDDAITIATWNLEWLVSPATIHAGRLACRSGQRANLPCDVVRELARDSADVARLAQYARALNADIVAFQEVENEAIARKVFHGYRICMADGGGVQHVGFAVRPALSHRCGPAEDSLSLDGRSRKAMFLQVMPRRGAPIELLVVHLKSGCSREPLESDTAACRILEQQSVQLGSWIAAKSAEHANFIVLGDFNRVPPQSGDDTFWRQVQTGPLELLAERLPFSNCFAGQPYSAFIDHMLLSNTLAESLVPKRSKHVGFRSADAVRYLLSDHCPVSITLSLSGNRRAAAELSSLAY